MDSLNSEGACTFAMLGWSLWKACNLLIFEGKLLYELEIVHHALRYLSEFQNAAYNRVKKDKPKEHRTSWRKPPSGPANSILMLLSLTAKLWALALSFGTPTGW
ncbi:hypothetical protein ACS0TY_012425 [Phlomoides rotata]